MNAARIPLIDPLISELRFHFVTQLISVRGYEEDVGTIADDAAFLADFVAGYLEEDEQLDFVFTPDEDPGDDSNIVDLFTR
jgi:hypothetical protein